MVRKSHEEFIKDFKIKYPESEISFLSRYEKSSKPILCRCGVCGNEWSPTPNSLLMGHGCPICQKNAKAQNLVKKDFVKDYYKNFPNTNVEVTGGYINSKTPIQCRCRICKNEWKPLPTNLIKGIQCPKCARKMQVKNQTPSKEQFIEKLDKKYPNNKIDVVGEYINSKTKIKCECKVCGKEWMPTPDNLIRGKGCPNCFVGGLKPKTNEKFLEEYNKKFPNSNIIFLSKYNGVKEKIQCKCKIHKYEWETTPDSLLQGHGCLKCGGSLPKTTDEFKKEFYKKFPNSNVEIIGEYKKESFPIPCKCKVCGNKWNTTTPHRLLYGSGCPKCANSKGNNLIEEILKNNGVQFEKEMKFENCKLKDYLRFDFYIPSKEIAIEYDGKQHFKATGLYGGDEGFKTRIECDNIKNLYCQNNNICLLRIPYKYNPIKSSRKIEELVLEFLKTKEIPMEIKNFYSSQEFSQYLK